MSELADAIVPVVLAGCFVGFLLVAMSMRTDRSCTGWSGGMWGCLLPLGVVAAIVVFAIFMAGGAEDRREHSAYCGGREVVMRFEDMHAWYYCDGDATRIPGQ